jgi:hypothetical protein
MTKTFPIAALAAMMCACSGGAPKPQPPIARTPSTEPVPAPPDPLFRDIPHDTAFLYIDDDPGGTEGLVSKGIDLFQREIVPLLPRIKDEKLAAESTETQLAIAIARRFAELDEDGWYGLAVGAPNTRLVLYNHGLVPVARLEIEGRVLRAMISNAARRAELPEPFERWQGYEYLRWPLPGGKVELVVLVRDDQVAIAVAPNAADIVPHLAGEAPLDRPIALDDATIGRFDPASAAALLRDNDRTLSELVGVPAGCGAALAAFAAELPPIVVTATHTTETSTVRVRVGPWARLTTPLRRSARPISHWPTNPLPEGEMIVGAGTSMRPFIDTLNAAVAAFEPARTTCGYADTGPADIHTLVQLAGPLDAIGAFTAVYRYTDMAAPVQINAVGDVADPEAFYQLIARSFGLATTTPALDRHTAYDIGTGPLLLALHRDAISIAIGGHDPDTIAAIRRAPPAPAGAIMHIASGGLDLTRPRPFDLTMTLDGDSLVVDHTTPR